MHEIRELLQGLLQIPRTEWKILNAESRSTTRGMWVFILYRDLVAVTKDDDCKVSVNIHLDRLPTDERNIMLTLQHKILSLDCDLQDISAAVVALKEK